MKWCESPQRCMRLRPQRRGDPIHWLAPLEKTAVFAHLRIIVHLGKNFSIGLLQVQNPKELQVICFDADAHLRILKGLWGRFFVSAHFKELER